MIGRATLLAIVGAGLLSADVRSGNRQQRLRQSDIGIQALTVQIEAGAMVSRVVVYAGMDDPSDGVHLEVLLPPGSTVIRMPAECAATPDVRGSPVRGRISCSLGTLAVNERRNLVFASSVPLPNVPKAVAAFVSSDAPDPRPGDNFSLKILP